jgi:PadR family transcriptional regulator PadR
MMEHSGDGKDRRVTQLRKGILELAVLRALCHEKHYGYSLVRGLSESGATFQEGTIYPVLARLDRDGLVQTEWVESGQGPPRKYYAITQAGRRLFDELSREFEILVSLVRAEKPRAGHSIEIGRKLVVGKR